MEHLSTITATITKEAVNNNPRIDMVIRYSISDFAIELCNMLKNIRETSFSESDKIDRIEKLSKQTGIDASTLKMIC